MFCWKSGRSVCENLAGLCCRRREKVVIWRSQGCESTTTQRRQRSCWSLRRNCSLGTRKWPYFRVFRNRNFPFSRRAKIEMFSQKSGYLMWKIGAPSCCNRHEKMDICKSQGCNSSVEINVVFALSCGVVDFVVLWTCQMTQTFHIYYNIKKVANFSNQTTTFL